jgi:hypothetical protein
MTNEVTNEWSNEVTKKIIDHEEEEVHTHTQ